MVFNACCGIRQGDFLLRILCQAEEDDHVYGVNFQEIDLEEAREIKKCLRQILCGLDSGLTMLNHQYNSGKMYNRLISLLFVVFWVQECYHKSKYLGIPFRSKAVDQSSSKYCGKTQAKTCYLENEEIISQAGRLVLIKYVMQIFLLLSLFVIRLINCADGSIRVRKMHNQGNMYEKIEINRYAKTIRWFVA